MDDSQDATRLRVLFDQILDCPNEAAQDALLETLARSEDASCVALLRRLLRADRTLARLDSTTPAPPAAPAAVSLPAFGPYQAIEVLGRGGMGTVYLAVRVDGQFEQRVAIKAVSAPILDLVGRAQFLRERQILAGLQHPGIANLVDGGVTPDGTPYLAMEFVSGVHLDKYCNEQRLTIRRRVELLREVCEAVAYAHRNLVVHRDLKPSNILVTAEGRPKLLDFGTARAQSDELTAGYAMLTPRYASPEQLRNEAVSTSADIYALGVILAELITGQWPFGDPASPVAALRRAVELLEPAPLQQDASAEHAQRCDTSLAALQTELSGDLSAVVGRCLAADPEQRYRSVDELGEDLRRYLAGQTVLARPQTAGYRLARFLGRHRRAAAATALAAALVVLLGAFAARQYQQRLLRSAQLRDLNRVLLGDIYREVGGLSGSAKARAMIARHTRQTLDDLLASGPSDETVREALAVAYLKLAEVQGEPFSLSLGDSAAAMASYRNAERMAKAHPALWVRACIGIAGLQIRGGEYPEAVATIRRALPVAATLGSVANGEDGKSLYLRLHRALGHALLREANQHFDVERMKEAVAQNELAVRIARELQQADPRLPDLAAKQSQYVGFANEILAQRTGDISRYQQAVDAHRVFAVGAARDFARTGSPQDRRDLADAHSFLGAARILARDDAGAVRDLAAAVDHFNVLAAADQSAHELDLDLALAHFFWGEAEIGLRRFASASDHLRRAETLAQLPTRPVDLDREKVELYIRIQQQWARLHWLQKDFVSALRALDEAQRVGETWKKLPPWEMERISRKRQAIESARTGARPSQVTPHDWLH